MSKAKGRKKHQADPVAETDTAPVLRKSDRKNKGKPAPRYGSFVSGIGPNSTEHGYRNNTDDEGELSDPEDTTLMDTMIANVNESVRVAVSNSMKNVLKKQEEMQKNIEKLKLTLQNTQPNSAPTAGANQTVNSTIAIHHKLYDLPEFNGAAEEWPMFHAAFQETTAAYGYTELQNMTRLRKALKGVAADTVRSLMIHPNNVKEVISELEFRFGRSDILVTDQIEKVRNMTSIREYELDKLIGFSTVVKNLHSFLTNAAAHDQLSNPTLINELLSKLPLSKRYDWATYAMKHRPVTIKTFSTWLDEVAHSVALIIGVKNERPNNARRRDQVLQTRPCTECQFCQKDHKIEECNEFLRLSVDRRWDWARNQRVCFGCLIPGHPAAECERCQRCNMNDCPRRHHRLLHDDQPARVNLHAKVPMPGGVLFKVIPVKLFNASKEVDTYALLDDGSSVTLIDSQLVSALELTGTEDELTLQWFGKQVNRQKTVVVTCAIRGSGPRMVLHNARSVTGLSLPTQEVELKRLVEEFPGISCLPIESLARVRPQILIGLDNAHLMIAKQVIPADSGLLSAVETSLGWTVYGATQSPAQSQVLLIDTTFDWDEAERLAQLERLADEYFETESLTLFKPDRLYENDDNRRARQMLEETTKRIGDRFETGLLWRTDCTVLPDSRPMAIRRMINLEKKLQRDPELARLYKSGIEAYVNKGYARRLQDEEVWKTTDTTWYLPHFGVSSSSKPGKIRIVFDAAARVGGVSLNSELLTGPDLNQRLTKVLYQFREFKVAVTADIREMFPQIKMRPSDQDSQRFMWRDEVSGQIATYVMTSMVFGMRCSPCSAQFVKNLNAENHKDVYPEACKIIQDNSYVDDTAVSFDSDDTAISVMTDVITVYANGGFELRSFVSNSTPVADVLNGLSAQFAQWADTDVVLEEPTVLLPDKILGMYWHSDVDSFVFHIRTQKVPPEVISRQVVPTKRQLLSVIMSVFDPFGYLSPFVLAAKTLMQTTFDQRLGWDETIPSKTADKWQE